MHKLLLVLIISFYSATAKNLRKFLISESLEKVNSNKSWKNSIKVGKVLDYEATIFQKFNWNNHVIKVRPLKICERVFLLSGNSYL